LRAVGELLPAISDIDTRLFEPPEQRHRVRDVEQVVGRFRPHLAVVKVEDPVERAELDQEETTMPERVIDEVVGIRLAPAQSRVRT
jgi:hypothetical protein